MDPLEIKNKKIEILQKEENEKVQRLIELTSEVNTIKDKADEAIEKFKLAVEAAYLEYINAVNRLGVITVTVTDMQKEE